MCAKEHGMVLVQRPFFRNKSHHLTGRLTESEVFNSSSPCARGQVMPSGHCCGCFQCGQREYLSDIVPGVSVLGSGKKEAVKPDIAPKLRSHSASYKTATICIDIHVSWPIKGR